MFETFLVSQLFAFLLVFCRLGSAIMLLPGFGESYVTPQARLFMALLFSLILAPTITTLPPVPTTTFGLMSVIIAEMMIGLFIGGMCRMLIGALHMAGTIIAMQAGLASAMTQDVTQTQGQATALGNFLSMSAIVLIFASDMHHLMLRALSDSYGLFLPGRFPPIGDIAEHASHTIDGTFHVAMQLSAPMIVISIVLYLAAGIISRLLPAIQIFFIMSAPQMLISFFILMLTFSGMMLWYLEYFASTVQTFVMPANG